MNLKEEIQFEYYAIKAKVKKAVQFYRLWKKWCNTFDDNYASAFNRHFKE